MALRAYIFSAYGEDYVSYFFIERWIGFLWLGFLVIWWLAAITTKRTVQRQDSGSRILQILMGVAGVILLFNLWGARKPGWINERILPHDAAWAGVGVALTLGGILFAFWARAILGRNWSGRVTIKQDHELILRGPYTFVRHPIYTGIITGLFGTALIYGDVRGFLGVFLYALGLWIKSRTEERFMLQQFGEQYAQYRERTRALIPFVL